MGNKLLEHKIFVSQAMQQGKRLEKEIEVKRITQLPFQNCDLFFISNIRNIAWYSSDDFIIEVKCPSSSKTFDQFLLYGKINEKCKAQMNMQVFATGKKRGLFCIADPKFETGKQDM